MNIEQFREYKKSLLVVCMTIKDSNELNKILTPLENEIGRDLPDEDALFRVNRQFMHLACASLALIKKLENDADILDDEIVELKEALKLAGF